jgi:hypothetical protein
VAADSDLAWRELPAAPVGKIEIVQGLRALAVLLVVWTHSIVAAAYHSNPKQGTFFHLKSFGVCGLDIFSVIDIKLQPDPGLPLREFRKLLMAPKFHANIRNYVTYADFTDLIHMRRRQGSTSC